MGIWMWMPYGRLERAHVLSRTSGGSGNLLVQKTVNESRVEVATLRQRKHRSWHKKREREEREQKRKEKSQRRAKPVSSPCVCVLSPACASSSPMSTMTRFDPSPISLSCICAAMTMILAAGCATSSSFSRVAVSDVTKILSRWLINILFMPRGREGRGEDWDEHKDVSKGRNETRDRRREG